MRITPEANRSWRRWLVSRRRSWPVIEKVYCQQYPRLMCIGHWSQRSWSGPTSSLAFSQNHPLSLATYYSKREDHDVCLRREVRPPGDCSMRLLHEETPLCPRMYPRMSIRKDANDVTSGRTMMCNRVRFKNCYTSVTRCPLRSILMRI